MPTEKANGKGETTSPNANTNGSSVAPDQPTATNETDSKVPDWFNANIFEDTLKENVPNYKKIVNFKALPALAPGENYATVMLRTEIDVQLQDGKTKSLFYMCKVRTDSLMMLKMIKQHNIFDVEAQMYYEVVPEFEKMYQDVGVEIKFGAQFYKLSHEKDLICLEDLGPRGFKNANRLEGLDIDHVHCVLKKLAQWHAASAVRVATKGQYPDIISKGFYTDARREVFKQIIDSMAKPFRQCLPTYKGHELYLASLDKLQNNYVDIVFKTSTIDTSEFNVLNHGDLWCNNIMFQYDAFAKVKETFFVDYQIPKYGTPAQDLYYFLLSSTKLELKLKHFDYFVKFYHDNLIENLKLLKYSKPLPALKDIHAILYKYGIWGYSTAIGVMAAVLLDPTENANLDNFLGDNADGNDFKMLMFSNPRYRKHIEVILPWLHNRGAMEC